MTKILVAFSLLLSLPALADNPYSASDTTAVTTINAQCTTPAIGCTAQPGSSVTLKVGGRNAVSAQIIATNFTGTLSTYCSQDGGNSWSPVANRQNGMLSNGSSSGSAIAVFYTAATSQSQVAFILPFLGCTDVMVAASAAPTNSATVQIFSSNSTANPLPAVISIKGTQAPAFLGTQDAKDSGRTFVVLGADGVTPAIAETVVTFSLNKAGTVTGAQTTYAITSGKTLRLQSLACSITAGAAANRVRVAVRLNTGGACVAGSGLLMPAMELSPGYGTAAASEGGAYAEIPFPDGLELSGASWNVCLSESAVAASGTLTCTLVGFEY